MKNIILGVSSSIAIYKAADLANNLTKMQYHVEVVMTKNATHFVKPALFRALTGNRVYLDMFDESYTHNAEHISLAKKADYCLIAPATANVIGKIANGIADDMLTTVVMAMRDVPITVCPAMNTNMYENPIVKENIKKLKDRGFLIEEPREARLACGDTGKGALAEVSTLIDVVEQYFKA